MSIVPIRVQEPVLFATSNHGMRKHHKHQIISRASWKMTTLNFNSTLTNIEEKLSVPQSGTEEDPKFLKLDREFTDVDRIEFGQFVAREAVLDEEFWTAAWLRAESHWEDRTNERYINNYKRKFADQEFHALKRRSRKELDSSCIVVVKKEDNNIKSTVVGTLDVSIRYFLSGETFPGEKVKAPLFCSKNRTKQIKYGYIENLCVSKQARRQGIAMNMLSFAVNMAKAKGVDQVFVHVYKDNKPAQELYYKMGFEVVERENAQLWKREN